MVRGPALPSSSVHYRVSQVARANACLQVGRFTLCTVDQATGESPEARDGTGCS